MRYFMDVGVLADLENQGQWEAARALLYKMWVNDKMNSEKLIRLLSECWHILLELERNEIIDPDISYSAVQGVLIEIVEFGMENLMNDSRFLCVAGYMISLFPYYFYISDGNTENDNQYTAWEQKGIDMLRRSAEINPSDSVARVLSLGSINSSDKSLYEKAKKAVEVEINYLFPGDTAIELYFKNILNMHLSRFE